MNKEPTTINNKPLRAGYPHPLSVLSSVYMTEETTNNTQPEHLQSASTARLN